MEEYASNELTTMISTLLPAAFSTSAAHALINVRTVPLIPPSQLNRKRPRHNNHINPFTKNNHRHILNPLFATADPEIQSDSGSYVDLGTITPTNFNLDDSTLANVFQSSQLTSNNHTTSQQAVEQWRSNHWIVLIDDEPSIRLAIGDYLHSMGYTTITACDGPQSFLDVLLYSCGWSFLDNGGSSGSSNNGKPPPWMEGTESWRLPNCIISDIRMPGGVDGVELLELLRGSNDDVEDHEDDVDVKMKKKKKKKGRPKKGQEGSNTEYDTKDEYELLDAIVGSAANEPKKQSSGKILTAIDQAKQKLQVIRDTLTHHQMTSSPNNTLQQQQQQQQQQQYQQYPTSLLQIPVILLTAKAMVSDRIVGFKAGANNYLPKPFRPEELLGMVDRLLRKQERERKEWFMSGVDSGGGGDVMGNGRSEVSHFDIESYSASAQQVNDLRMELIEIKNLLKEQAQREIDVKLQHEEMERLSNLLPNALWMYMNGERRKRLFSLDHIRSILIFCFDDKSLARKRNVKRDDLLDELDRMNDVNPDALHDFLHG